MATSSAAAATLIVLIYLLQTTQLFISDRANTLCVRKAS